MLEDTFDAPWSPEQNKLYDDALSGIEVVYTDADHVERKPTAIENETDRIFSLLSDSVKLSVNQDATAFTQSVFVRTAYGTPHIFRVVEPNGELVRTRYSGLFFLPTVSNHALISEFDGRLSYDRYSEGSVSRNNFTTRLNLYTKLRSIK
jgi:hypothetical protein